MSIQEKRYKPSEVCKYINYFGSVSAIAISTLLIFATENISDQLDHPKDNIVTVELEY